MDEVNKFQTFTILGMVLIGILLGQVDIISMNAEYLITPALMIMLFLVFLQVPISEIGKSFKNIKFTTTAVIINFIITPIVIFILGRTFLSSNPEILIGFIMLMVTPCTDWYLIFTGMAKGNVALGSSILPLNLILQLLLMPIYILLIGGASINIEFIALLKGVIFTLIRPLVAATIIRHILIVRYDDEFFTTKITPKACDFQDYFLDLAIIAMFASQGKILLANLEVLVLLLIPIILFFIITFIIGRIAGRIINLNYSDSAALSLTTMARNSPIALSIAVTSFPDKPLIALALIIGPLIELPVLFIVARVLLIIRSRQDLK